MFLVSVTLYIYVECLEECQSLWDLTFVVDASGSICDADPNFNFTRDETCNNWNFVLQFIRRIADGLNIGLSEFRVGMVLFDTTSRVAWNLTAFTTKESLLNAIDRIPYRKGGRTDTTGGLNLMKTQVFGIEGDRPNVPNMAIIITDGKPSDPSTIQGAIDAVHNSGITTLVVGVTNQVDEATLKQLSSPPQQLGVTYFMATDFRTIDDVRSQLVNQTCGPAQTVISSTTTPAPITMPSTTLQTTRPVQTVITSLFTTPPTAAFTMPSTTLPTTRPVQTVITSLFTTPPTAAFTMPSAASSAPRETSECQSLWDLTFVVDASGSICDADPNFNFTRDEKCNNWNFVLQFIRRIADGLNIGLSEFRVGMVLFDTTSRVAWNLTAFTTKDSLLYAIERIPYRKGGRTDTTGGLNLIKTQVFGIDGDRPDVPNMAIIITDGKPSDPSTIQGAIDAVHNSGIKTLVVGVTNQVDEATLKQLSSPPQQLGVTYFMATDFRTIDDVRAQLTNQTCGPMQTVTSAVSTTATTVSLTIPPAASSTSRMRIVCETLWDLTFVVDASGSICDTDPNFNFTIDETCNNWNFILQFIRTIVDGLDIGRSEYRVGMVLFDTTARVGWNLTAFTTKDSLLNAIDRIQYRKGGRTDTTGGLKLMETQVFGIEGDRPDVPNIAIIITDGKPSDPSTIQGAIDAVHNSGITTFVVGVTNQVDEATLKQLSSPPQQLGVTYFMAKDFGTIDEVRQQLENRTCEAVQTVFSSPSTDSSTKPPISTIASSSLPSTSTTKQPLVCKSLRDICFVVDASGSICDTDPNFNYETDETCNNWSLILQFMNRLADGMNIGLSAFRVGMVLFDTTARVAWNLTTYNTKASLLNAIDHIQYRKGGRTNTTGGLNLMGTQVFGIEGDRPDVISTAIIITDGKPTDPSTVQGAIDAVHKSGITTLVVGVTNEVDEATLKQLSSPPQQLNVTYFMAAGFDTLDTIRDILQEQACGVTT